MPLSVTQNPKPRLVGAVGLAVLTAAALAILLVIPVPIHGRAFGYLMDLTHAPAFALLTWLVCNATSKRLPDALWRRLLVVALPLAACGLIAEFIQIFVNRGASWHDARANLLGACAGVILFELWSKRITRRQWPLWLAALGMITLASLGPGVLLYDCWQQYQDFPILASFESPLDVSRFIAQDSEMSQIPLTPEQDNWGLEIDLQPGEYPGIMLNGMPGDWSAYTVLSFDIIITEGPPLNLIVKVFDLDHMAHGYAGDDRYDKHFQFPSGKHHVEIPLSEVRSAPRTRKTDMRHIHSWQIFTYDLQEPRTIVLDNLRLR